MKLNKIYDITFDTEETIMAVALSKSNEVVMLMNSGNVIRFNLDSQTGKHLFSVKSDIGYSDGGFDITAKISIYTMDEIVVVVNDFKRHGFVHYPDKYYALQLWREDYHTDISTYPIALYKNTDRVPHLIFGQAWNHIQIMNLDTRQILTASKSLIEENAEQLHIEFYKNYNEENSLPWPRPYDYFFGKLKLSPNNKYFLSEGWNWGSSDSYTIYEIDKFIGSNRISTINVGCWEHLNRASCWINENLVAFGYNPLAEDDNGVNYKIASEIHLCEFAEKNSENKIMYTEGIDTINAQMKFNPKLNSIIVISKEIGISIINLDGKIILQNNDFKANSYNSETNRFLTMEDKGIIIHSIVA